MATEEHWITVRYGDAFPEGKQCIRAMGIPGMNQETVCYNPHPAPDTYIALWVRPDGESVFGCAWNEDGKVRAKFTWDGKKVTDKEAGGFRIMKFCKGDKYHWVPAKSADEHKLLYVGEYTPAVVVRGCNARVGKASWKRKMAWICEKNAESCVQGSNFNDCYLLANK